MRVTKNVLRLSQKLLFPLINNLEQALFTWQNSGKE